jgi:hypothetical protein
MLPEKALQLITADVPKNPWEIQIQAIIASGNEPEAWMEECARVWSAGADAMTRYFLGLDQQEAERTTRVCKGPGCSTILENPRANKVYCSTSCRMRAYRKSPTYSKNRRKSGEKL